MLSGLISRKCVTLILDLKVSVAQLCLSHFKKGVDLPYQSLSS